MIELGSVNFHFPSRLWASATMSQGSSSGFMVHSSVDSLGSKAGLPDLKSLFYIFI